MREAEACGALQKVLRVYKKGQSSGQQVVSNPDNPDPERTQRMARIIEEAVAKHQADAAAWLDVRNHVCPICQSVPNVPASIACDGCNNRPLDIGHSTTVKLVKRTVCCKACLDTFFELYKPPARRTPQRRHLVCSRTYNLAQIAANGVSPYRVEYEMLQHADNTGVRPAPCQLCDATFGTCRELAAHQASCVP